MRSTDDKAYIRPSTSEGFDKARNIRILTLSDEAKARKLPKYDWPEKLVYVTPGSHRIFTKSSITMEGEEKLITQDDFHHVFVRPKSNACFLRDETSKLLNHPNTILVKAHSRS